MSPSPLAEHFFRHEYGRLVALLARRVGVEHLEAVEDAVQSALLAGLESWSRTGRPEEPSAWLYRVAFNHLQGELRQAGARRRILERSASDASPAELAPTHAFLSGEVQDELLRMLFLCCDDTLPVQHQLVLALKILCGFDVREIAHRLFISEDNVYKRLTRARQRLRARPIRVEELNATQLRERLPSVHRILYLLFTEGYLSVHAEHAIRRELCDEALRLTTLLAEHANGQTPETFALLALMHLHAARLSARESATGGLLLLEEQDRSLWDAQQIQAGLSWLARSAQGDDFSRYHAEAAIAAEHCLAPSFSETPWKRVVESYEMLERVAPSALHRLNLAVAVAEWRGAPAGLKALEGFEPPSWLTGSYLWAAVLADLHRRCGNDDDAQHYGRRALDAAPTPAIRTLLARRLAGVR